MEQLLTLLKEYHEKKGEEREVNKELGQLLSQLPISDYGGLTLDGEGYKVSIRWHTPEMQIFAFSVLCPHNKYFECCSSGCYPWDQPEISPEEIFGLIIRDLTEMVKSLGKKVTARNQLARGLRTALANKQ